MDRTTLTVPTSTASHNQFATVATPSSFDMGEYLNTGIVFVKYLGMIMGLLFLGVLLYKMIKYCVVFFYDVWNVDRMVYLRVLQTRGDSKVDREVSKELAKDMKEKIARMSQVYNNIYKLGEASFYESILSFLVKKPKVVLTLAYEDGKLEFIIGVYPEFRAIVEGAISAQFSDSSIEITEKPRFFQKKYSDLSVLEPEKDTVYTIKNYKYMPDDPLNNLVDSIAKVNAEDTFHVLMVLKPMDERHNKRVKIFADALFKKQESKIRRTPWWHYIIMPWKIFGFFIFGPSREILDNKKNQPDGMVRMIKAEEDAYQSMGEEAANHAFETGLVLLTSSDIPDRLTSNLQNVTSAYSVYTEQYLNEIKESNIKKDVF